MKACVLVKEVPDARASRTIDPVNGRLDRSVQSGLNSYDRYALEAAVRLRESGQLRELEVVAVTMGPAVAQRTLRRAAALGAERLIHLCDEALAGSDAAATGYALAQVLRAEQPDLILCGEQSDDAGTAVIAAVIAEHLQLALATQAASVRAQDGALVIERLTETGAQLLDVPLPAVISLAPSANTPRYASLKQTIAARELAVTTIDCAGAGIDPERIGTYGSALGCGDWHAPEPRTAGTLMQSVDADEAVRAIVAWLRARKLIG